jgi:hypothetical protein
MCVDLPRGAPGGSGHDIAVVFDYIKGRLKENA